jgi:tRNA A37 N6-isopentenylltransferase MiaA
MGSSKNNLQWDESRSPQWRYLLGKKDPKYNSRKREKDHLFNEAKQKRDKYTKPSQTDTEIAEMTDCSSKNDLINAELTTQLNKIDKSRVRRVKNNDIRRITRISVRAKT